MWASLEAQPADEDGTDGEGTDGGGTEGYGADGEAAGGAGPGLPGFAKGAGEGRERGFLVAASVVRRARADAQVFCFG